MVVFIVIPKERPMESPIENYIIVDKFREGVFNYIIKPDVMRMDLQNGNVTIGDIVLKDTFDVNKNNGTISRYFDVILDGGRYWSNIHRLQERISKTIELGIKSFYPSNEFVILDGHIKILNTDYFSYDWND